MDSPDHRITWNDIRSRDGFPTLRAWMDELSRRQACGILIRWPGSARLLPFDPTRSYLVTLGPTFLCYHHRGYPITCFTRDKQRLDLRLCCLHKSPCSWAARKPRNPADGWHLPVPTASLPAKWNVLWATLPRNMALATLEGGGHQMPVGNGTVLVGWANVHHHKAVGTISQRFCLKKAAARAVIACQAQNPATAMQSGHHIYFLRPATWLQAFKEVADESRSAMTCAPVSGKNTCLPQTHALFDVVAEVLGLTILKWLPTGGDDPADARARRGNDGNNVPWSISPGDGVLDRMDDTTRPQGRGIEVLAHTRRWSWAVGRAADALHELPPRFVTPSDRKDKTMGF